MYAKGLSKVELDKAEDIYQYRNDLKKHLDIFKEYR